jgi:hypothetical protein
VSNRYISKGLVWAAGLATHGMVILTWRVEITVHLALDILPLNSPCACVGTEPQLKLILSACPQRKSSLPDNQKSHRITM